MDLDLENQEESRREEWRKSDANNLVMRSGAPVSTLDISLMEVEAVCGLYQATQSVSLEEMEGEFHQSLGTVSSWECGFLGLFNFL